MAPPPSVLTRDSPEYEKYRRAYVNSNVPDIYPSEIHVVPDTAAVAAALLRANELDVHVGVRSGGHLFTCSSLLDGGILIDTSHLNRRVEYNPSTHEIDFGPAVRVKEAAEVLQDVGRFFPYGHAPSVALGGFCLAGGQGWFMRGWGMTVETWVLRMEIVAADGSIRTASRTENTDLFWAARGSGQGFFGVVTRIWVKTIPAKKLFARSLVFRNVEAQFEKLAAFAFERNALTPRYGNETAFTTFHPAKFNPEYREDAIPEGSPLMLAISVLAYTDTLEEARTLLAAWDQVPGHLQDCLIEAKPIEATTWHALFALQDALVPWGNGERWQCNSILSDPSVPEAQLIKTMKPAFCDLATVQSCGCLYIGDSDCSDAECACSLPQKYYVANFTGWKDAALEPVVQQNIRSVYRKIESVSCGMYVADYDGQDATDEIKVMTDRALDRFLKIRSEWDPKGRFPGYLAFLRSKDRQRLQ